MAYTPYNADWKDYPDVTTPITEAALEHIETGIVNAHTTADAAVAETVVDAKGDLLVASAADTVTRLAVGANDYVLTADSAQATGLKWAAASTVLTRTATSVDVASTVAETNLLSYSVTGNAMSTNKLLRLTMFGDVLYNNSASDTLTLRVKFGGTTYWADSTGGADISATRQPWVLSLNVANMDSAASQAIFGSLVSGSIHDPSSPTTGIGAVSTIDTSSAAHNANPSGGALGISTLATVDTTSAATFAVTAQWSASSANNSWRMRYAVLELI